ncbi:MAG: SgcJ/EcaC family oxidoreductase [Myxococcota bacterium]
MNSRRPVLALFLFISACAEQRPPETPRCEQSTQTPPVAQPAAPSAQSAAPAEQTEPAIRALLARQAEDWNRHDAKAWVAPFSEDAEFINILGTVLHGRTEIEARHDQIFKTIFARSRVVVTTRTVRLLGTNAALAETDYELRDYDRLPPGIQATDADGTLRTRLKYVWELKPEGWRIVSAQNTAIVPQRPPPVAAQSANKP